jgi:hypothetical protein
MLLFCVCAVLCARSGLTTGWSFVEGVLPLCKRPRNWKSGQGQTESSIAINRQIDRYYFYETFSI